MDVDWAKGGGLESPRGNVLLGKYEMGRVLGQGKFAKVYYGRSLSSGEGVAIKVISKDHVMKEGLMEQIKREISVMRLVRHPNIVELKEVLATKTKIYFVMEHVRGGELFEKVVRGRLKEDVARKYFQQLVSAVDFCHSRGVSHRDLKPENLLLDDNGNLKVSDFGLSSLPEQLRIDGLLHTQCGTPAYLAPEVLRKKGYDGAKADIWSCGVILFVLLAGYLPFRADNVVKMYNKVFKTEYEFPPWISPDARRLISKLLVADPERRISIPAIMKVPWFQKGFSRPLAISVQEPPEKEDHPAGDLKSSPPFFNAFELISSMSSGFDLSAMFEPKKKSGSLFTSKTPPLAILAKLQEVGKTLNFAVSIKDYKVKMQKKVEGRKGKLSVTAEVSKAAPQLAVVEFAKSSGDTFEYNKFCEEDARPALSDIVWTWQGEGNRH